MRRRAEEPGFEYMGLDAALSLSAVGVSIPLAEIYRDVLHDAGPAITSPAP